MKGLLVLAPSYPYPVQDGTQLRVHNLFRRFPVGLETTLVCFDAVPSRIEAPLPEPLTGTCIRLPAPRRVTGWRASQLTQVCRPLPAMIWKFFTPEMALEVGRRSREADAVLVIGLQMGQYLRNVRPGIPTVLDNYNVEWLILSRMAATRPLSRRWFWLLEAQKLRRSEGALLREANSVIAISDVDRDGMAALAPEARFFTVPNGVELSFFRSDFRTEPPPAGSAPRFSFVGALNWHVNEDAAVWLCTEVWPRIRQKLPAAELWLVGKDPSPTVRALGSDASVQITGTVPDVRPYIADSTAVVVPLRYGSGIRNKILEGFASGRPIVTTSVGCEGLPVGNGKELLIADDAAAFAEACVRLATEKELSERLVTAGRTLVEEMDRDVTRRFQDVLTDGLGLTDSAETVTLEPVA